MTQEADAGGVERFHLVLLFGLAFILRIGFAIDYVGFHPTADRPAIDEASYESWAIEIAGGDWVGDEVFFQEPLYPYWLGSVYAVWGHGATEADVVRRRRTGTRHIQSFYGALAVVGLTLVGARLFGRRAGLFTGVALATYRPLLYFPALFLKPNLFVPLLVLLAWLALVVIPGPRAAGGSARRRLLLWSAVGLCAGLGALLRGNMLLLLPAFVLLPVVRALVGRKVAGETASETGRASISTALAPAGAVLAGILLALLPVLVRNQAVGGVFALTTSGAGTNLYGGNNAENPTGRATEFSWVRGIPEHEADDWKHEAERRSGRVLDPGEVSSFWMKETLSSLRADPLLHLSILWNKLRLTLGSYEVPDNHHIEWDARFVSGLRAPFPGFGLWGMLGLAGLLVFLARRFVSGGGAGARDARGAYELAAFFALYLATIVLTVTSMRIRLALVPLLLPFAGYLLDALLPRGPLRFRGPVLAAAAGALAVAALAVHWPVFSAEERAEDFLKRDYNLAVHLLKEGQLEEAGEVIERLGSERSDTIPVNLLGADLAYRRGVQAQIAAAPAAEIEAHFDLALELLKPVATGASTPPRDRFRAQKIAGLVHFEVESYDVAERRFREALAFDPTDPDVLLRLANILWIRVPELAGDARLQALLETRRILATPDVQEAFPEAAARLAEVKAALSE